MMELLKYLKVYSILFVLFLALSNCSQNQIPTVLNINLEKSKSQTNITAIQNNKNTDNTSKTNKNSSAIKEKFNANGSDKIIKVTFERPYSNPEMDLFIGLDAIKSDYTADFYVKLPGLRKQLLKDKSVDFILKFRWNKETYLLKITEVNVVYNYVKFKLEKLR